MEKLYSSDQSLDLMSQKCEEYDKFELSYDGYFDTKIFNFCHMASLKFHTFSVAHQL